MNSTARVNRSLANFAVLIMFGIAVTLFLVYKANQAVVELDTLEHPLERAYKDFK